VIVLFKAVARPSCDFRTFLAVPPPAPQTCPSLERHEKTAKSGTQGEGRKDKISIYTVNMNFIKKINI
jgi:hypothetical protein